MEIVYSGQVSGRGPVENKVEGHILERVGDRPCGNGSARVFAGLSPEGGEHANTPSPNNSSYLEATPCVAIAIAYPLVYSREVFDALCGRSGNWSTRVFVGVSKENADNVSPSTRQENAKKEEVSDKKRKT